MSEFTLKYMVKVIEKEKVEYNGEIYTNVLEKRGYLTARTFREDFSKIEKRWKSGNYEIITYQNIRGKWYICPKPKTVK